ncbi:MAG TPA: flagellar motor protein MotB [Candidatus Megaira endosymbiont of Hartmannula sinica]|nr:flagellar motor protein MotB [Candidatus Megaera endosymbiont of Hartmannula sinica]
MTTNDKIIIRKKRSNDILEVKKSGAVWKIAYADFITALMVFFLVLWLVTTSSKEELEKVSKYFSDKPIENLTGDSNLDESKVDTNQLNSFVKNNQDIIEEIYFLDESQNLTSANKSNFLNIARVIRDNQTLNNFSENIALVLTDEGLCIDIHDSYSRAMFNQYSSIAHNYVHKIIDNISDVISKNNSYISISGYIARYPSNAEKSFNSWSLSSKRAIAVNDMLINSLKKHNNPSNTPHLKAEKRVVKILAMADKYPLDNIDPYNIKNNRIRIILLSDKALDNRHKISSDLD